MSYRRNPAAVRAPHVAVNILRNCHSSCCVELGQTRVICAISPPQQLIHEYRGKRGRIAVHLHHAMNSINNDNSSKHNSNNDIVSTFTPSTSSFLFLASRDDNLNNTDRALALALQGVAEQVVNLNSIPQLLVQVFIEVIHDDGAVLDAATLAMSSALAQGQFEMKDMFAACSAGVMKCGGQIVTDLRHYEEMQASVQVNVVTTLTTNRIVYFTQCGSCEPTTLLQLMETAMNGVQQRKQFWLSQLRA